MSQLEQTLSSPAGASDDAPAGAAPETCLPLRRLGHVISGLCYWAMLAAGTVGPGTITLMAKGGADMRHIVTPEGCDRHAEDGGDNICTGHAPSVGLAWTVAVASLIAYALQEAGARLQIVTETSFGAGMYVHFTKCGAGNRIGVAGAPAMPAGAGGSPPWLKKLRRLVGAEASTPFISIVMAVLIVLSNTVTECAQVAGMMSAVEY